MSDPIIDPLLIFSDDEIDAADLATRLEKKAQQVDQPAEWWPRYGEAIDKAAEKNNGFRQQQIEYHLNRARRLLAEDEALSEPVLAPSPATRLPFIGRLWGSMRAQIHALVLFYVNRQRARQAEIDHHLLQVVTALQQQNQQLADRLAEFENRSDPSSNERR